eukprot:gene7253-11571_t
MEEEEKNISDVSKLQSIDISSESNSNSGNISKNEDEDAKNKKNKNSVTEETIQNVKIMNNDEIKEIKTPLKIENITNSEKEIVEEEEINKEEMIEISFQNISIENQKEIIKHIHRVLKNQEKEEIKKSGNFKIYKDFLIDQVGLQNESIPIYDKNMTESLPLKKETKFKYVGRCFNCSSFDHEIRSCPHSKNQREIDINREEFLKFKDLSDYSNQSKRFFKYSIDEIENGINTSHDEERNDNMYRRIDKRKYTNESNYKVENQYPFDNYRNDSRGSYNDYRGGGGGGGYRDDSRGGGYGDDYRRNYGFERDRRNEYQVQDGNYQSRKYNDYNEVKDNYYDRSRNYAELRNEYYGKRKYDDYESDFHSKKRRKKDW